MSRALVRRMLVVACTLLATGGLCVATLGCRGNPAPERVLYLREAQPAAGSAFGRVNPRTFDLGSLSAAPPDRMELRACGDVVAFAGAPEVLPDKGIEVREVMYRIWWTSGVGRGLLSLWAPGQGGGLAAHPVSSCVVPTSDPAHEAGFFKTVARVPVGRTLSAADLAGLHVLLDVAGAYVVVGSCPGRASMIVINPPPDEVLAARDSDGDGTSDLDELMGTGDPWRADDGGPCLAHADPVAEMPHCPVATVQGEERDGGVLTGEQRWEDQEVRLRGPLRVEGTLRIVDSRVSLLPDDEGRAGIEVVEGGRLEVVEGSLLAAADPAVGFSLRARRGSALLLEGSELQHIGTLDVDESGYARWEGVVIETSDAAVRGSTFRWGLSALELMGAGVVVEDNTFEHDGTAVLVRASGVVLRGNRSVGGGVFARVDAGADGALIEGNRLERTVDMGIKVLDGVSGVRIVGNHFEHVHQGIEYRRVEELELRDNTVRACIQPFLPLLSEAPPGVVAQGNTVLRPDPAACRIVLPANQPDQYPGGAPTEGRQRSPP